MRQIWKKWKKETFYYLSMIIGFWFSWQALKNGLSNPNLSGYKLIKTVLEDITNAIPAIALLVGILIGGIDLIMLLSDIYSNWHQKKIKEAEERGATGIKTQISEWNNRRLQAEARGEKFNEPLPDLEAEKKSDKRSKC